jgi:hypothetical protein
MPPRINLVGKKFGKLEVISISHKTIHRKTVYNCLCICGNITKGHDSDLKSGKHKSCGWSTDIIQHNNTRFNNFISFKGTKLSLSQWCKKLDIKFSTLYNRLNTIKWSINDSLTVPIKRKSTPKSDI